MAFKDPKKKKQYHSWYMKNVWLKIPANKAKHLKYVNRGDKTYVKWVYSLRVGRKCKYCDEAHPSCLDFHHINPADKKYTIASLKSNRKAKQEVLDEVEKCDVVCANCHRKLHHNERVGINGEHYFNFIG